MRFEGKPWFPTSLFSKGLCGGHLKVRGNSWEHLPTQKGQQKYACSHLNTFLVNPSAATACPLQLPPPTSHLNPSFLCPSSSLGTEQSLTLPHCISLKRVASWSLPTTCPAPLKQREGSRGPVKCFKLFHSWGLSKAHSY